jgi:ribosomal protein L7/L12
MDMMKFIKLISVISSKYGSFSEADIAGIMQMVQECVTNEPVSPNYVSMQLVNELLAVMNVDGKKIEAIKAYRALTGEGLREAKDAVERYWVQQK